MGDLLPCPFCGACLDYAAPVAYFHPIGKCILSGRNFKKGVIGQWNRRAIPARGVEVPEELAKQIIDRSIARLQALHDYAGRPSWDQVVAEEMRAALKSEGRRIEDATYGGKDG